jgi:hypothetical protein
MTTELNGDAAMASAVGESSARARPLQLAPTSRNASGAGVRAVSHNHTADAGDSCEQTARMIDAVFAAVVALAVVAVVGVPAIAVSNVDARGWLESHTAWLLVGYGNLLAILLFTSIAWWSRHRSTAVRVASLILVGSPAVFDDRREVLHTEFGGLLGAQS